MGTSKYRSSIVLSVIIAVAGIVTLSHAQDMKRFNRPMHCERISSDGRSLTQLSQDSQELSLACWDKAVELNPNLQGPAQLVISFTEQHTIWNRISRHPIKAQGDPSQPAYSVNFIIEAPDNSLNSFDLVHAARAMDILVTELTQNTDNSIISVRNAVPAEDRVGITIDGREHATGLFIVGTLDSNNKTDEWKAASAFLLQMKTGFYVNTPASLTHYDPQLAQVDEHATKTSWFVENQGLNKIEGVAVGNSRVSLLEGKLDMRWVDGQEGVIQPKATRFLELKDGNSSPLGKRNYTKLNDCSFYDTLELPVRHAKARLVSQTAAVKSLHHYFKNIAAQGYTQVGIVFPVGWGANGKARYPYIARTILHALHTLPKPYSFYKVEILFTGFAGPGAARRPHQFIDAAITLQSGYFLTLEQLEDPEVDYHYLSAMGLDPQWLRLLMHGQKVFVGYQHVLDVIDSIVGMDVIMPIAYASDNPDDLQRFEDYFLDKRWYASLTQIHDDLVPLSKQPGAIAWAVDMALSRAHQDGKKKVVLPFFLPTINHQARLREAIFGVGNFIHKSAADKTALSTIVMGPHLWGPSNITLSVEQSGARRYHRRDRYYYAAWEVWQEWRKQYTTKPWPQIGQPKLSSEDHIALRIETLATALYRNYGKEENLDLDVVRAKVWSQCPEFETRLANNRMPENPQELLQIKDGAFVPFSDDETGRSRQVVIEGILATWPNPLARIDFYKAYCLEDRELVVQNILK